MTKDDAVLLVGFAGMGMVAGVWAHEIPKVLGKSVAEFVAQKVDGQKAKLWAARITEALSGIAMGLGGAYIVKRAQEEIARIFNVAGEECQLEVDIEFGTQQFLLHECVNNHPLLENYESLAGEELIHRFHTAQTECMQKVTKIFAEESADRNALFRDCLADHPVLDNFSKYMGLKFAGAFLVGMAITVILMRYVKGEEDDLL